MLVRMSQHNARALGAEELILSHFSLAPMHDIEKRVRLAAVVRTIRATGTEVPWSIEAPSAVGWANPAVHIAALANGMRKFM